MSLMQELRKRQGDMSQVEFAAKLGIRQSTLSRLLRGDQELGVDVARKIKRVFPDLTLDVAQTLLADDIPAEQESDPPAA